jgi:arylsulfatase A
MFKLPHGNAAFGERRLPESLVEANQFQLNFNSISTKPLNCYKNFMTKNILRNLVTSFFVCISFAVSSLPSAENTGQKNTAQKKERPNVIVIMADDFGYECVRANGGESYQTPNIDRLAESGVRFEQFYVQPLCTPTRLQIMTGLYNVRNYTVFGKLHPSQKTFGNLFRDAGYVTGIFGKWQLGNEKELPKHFGFDTYTLWAHTQHLNRYTNPVLAVQGEHKEWTNGEYGPKIINDHALEFIETNKEKPFLLYYPMILTHAPFQPTPDSPDYDPALSSEKKGDTKHFKAMVEYADANVGRIIKKLEETGLTEKTLILFTGDNGTGRPITSQFKGKPYQGGKGSLNDSGMHVPLVVSFPGTIKSGVVNTNLADVTDILPTICDAAGIKTPTELPLDGISFYPQLLGQKDAPIRDWSYCWYLGQRNPGEESIFAQDKQYRLYPDGRFFDRVKDQDEKLPLNPDKAKEVFEKLQGVLNRYQNVRSEEIKQAQAAASSVTKKGKEKKIRKNK